MSIEFWEKRWASNQIGWDLGQVSPPIANYIDQLEDTSIKILIPGCGNAYEAEYLHQKGFKEVYIVDISKSAIEAFKKRYPLFPEFHIIHDDFFNLQGQYDLIIEQTFFCAINPQLRKKYVQQMTKLLKPGGKLVGLLFNVQFSGGPPYGGQKNEYLKLFKTHFNIEVMDTAYNSIQPRQNNELFVILRKK
jgi:SAM-dependent methyltransferase